MAGTSNGPSSFRCIYDAYGSPLAFQPNVEQALKLLSLGSTLVHEIIDFGKAAGFTNDEYVRAFDVYQASDSTVFIAIATGNRVARSAARLMILKPFKPADIDLASSEAIADLVIPQTKSLPGPIDKLIIDPNHLTGDFPSIVIACQDITKTKPRPDLFRVCVQKLYGWTIEDDTRLPTTADKILDLCPGFVANNPGVFALYEIDNACRILFKAYSKTMSVSVQCPSGAACISSLRSPSGTTDLIVAGDCVYHFAAYKLTRSNAAGTELTGAPKTRDVIALQSYKDESDFSSVWILDKKLGLYSLQFPGSDLSGDPNVVQILAPGMCKSFGTLQNGTRPTVVFGDHDRLLQWLEQSVDRKHWTRTPRKGAEVLSITLLEPLAPLKEVYAKENPDYQPSNLELWSCLSPQTTNSACTALSPSKKIDLAVKVKKDSRIAAAEWKLVGEISSSKNITFESDYYTFNQGLDASDVVVTMHGWSSEVPWGINEDISWTLMVEKGSSERRILLQQTPIEIYAVVKDIPPYYQSGLPVEFLRIMALPTIKQNITSRADWIEWAVKQCHASSFDEDLATKKPYTRPMHSFRYDVWSGSTRFTSGSAFHMDAWLTNREDKDRWMTLNCYDQSALVQVTLALGVPYTFLDAKGKPVVREKGEKLINYGALYKVQFGYIKATDLVGWGECDNPFFCEDTSRKLLKNDPGDPRANFRSAFYRHKWTYLRLTSEPYTFYALDACAGPIAKPVLLKAYLEEVVDSEPSKLKYPQFDLYEMDPLEGTSIDALDPKPVVPRKTGMEFKDLWDMAEKGQVENEVQAANRLILEQLKHLTNEESTDPKTLPVPVPIEEMYAELRSKLLKLYPNPHFFSEKNHPISIGEDGAHVAWDIHTKKGSPAWVSLTVDVLADYKNAVGVLWQRVSSMDTNPEDALAVPAIQQDKAGSIHFVGRYKNNLNIFVYGNVVVQLNGIAPSQDIEQLARDLDAFISGYKSANLAHVNFDGINVEWPRECRFGQNFDVKIRVSSDSTQTPNVSHIDIDFEETSISALQDPPLHTPKSGEWTFTCVAREHSGENWLVLSFAEQKTFLTSTRRYPITIVG